MGLDVSSAGGNGLGPPRTVLVVAYPSGSFDRLAGWCTAALGAAVTASSSLSQATTGVRDLTPDLVLVDSALVAGETAEAWTELVQAGAAAGIPILAMVDTESRPGWPATASQADEARVSDLLDPLTGLPNRILVGDRLDQALGCPQGQGYLFSRPLPPADIVEVLDAQGP